MKLVEISNELLNEAAKNPLSAFRAIFKAAGVNFAEVEAALFLGLKQINNKIVSISKATPEEIEKAFKTSAFKKYSQTIARSYIANNDKLINGILKKHPINTTQGSKAARAEIANTLGVNKSLADEIFVIKKPKPGPIPPKPPTPPNPPTPPTPPEELSWTKQFIQGMKLSALDYLKKIPGIKNKMSKIYTKQLEPLGVLKKRFDDIMNRISPKIAEGGEYEIVDELKELNDVLSQFSAQKQKQQSLVWSEWKNSLSKDLQDKLPKIEDPKFQEFYKYFESSVSGKIKKEPPTLTYTKMYAAMRMFKPGNKGLWGNLNQFRKRIGNTLTHMDPRTYDELGQTLEQYGKARGIGKEVGDKLIAVTVFWPGFFAVGQTILDYTAGKTNIDIWGSDTEYYNENKPILDNLYVDNILNIFRVLFLNYIDKLTMSKEEFTSLLGWSPALYALGLQFLGGDSEKSTNKDEIENNLNQSKKDIENTLPQLKDTLSNNPDLYERLKKIVPNIDETIKPDNTEKPKAENW